VLTTVLTTTGPDSMPCYLTLRSAYGQVSHGMPQPACSLQAKGQLLMPSIKWRLADFRARGDLAGTVACRGVSSANVAGQLSTR
jgi:hypothetical protein